MRLTRLSQVEALVKRANAGEDITLYFMFPHETEVHHRYKLHYASYIRDKIGNEPNGKMLCGVYRENMPENEPVHTLRASVFGDAEWYDNYWEAWAQALRNKKEAENG